MPTFKLLDDAKQLKESASERAKELAHEAPSCTDGLRIRAAEVTTQLKDRVTAQTTEAMDAGFAKMSEMLEDLNVAVPVLLEAGNQLDLLSVDLGLSPKIVLRFSTKMGVKEERFNELLQENAERRMTVFLLNALAKAKALQSRVRVAGLKPKGVEVEIGLMPEVSLRFG